MDGDIIGLMERRSERMETRPWGGFEVLSEMPDHKVKRVFISPGKRLSLQRHKFRSEHWHIVRGSGVVTIEGEERAVGVGDSVDIPAGAAHRLYNPAQTELVVIEIQRGEYFGEDDIERLEDDFGRI